MKADKDQDNMMETSRIGSTTPWPTISEAHKLEQKDNEDGESWEILSGEDQGSGSLSSSKNRLLKHCESSPNFGSIYFEEDESFIDVSADDSKSVSTALTEMSHVLVDVPSSTSEQAQVGGGMVKVHRVPSFKDAILLNAEEIKKEQIEKEKKQQALLDAMKRSKRRLTKPKYVVKEFRRCSHSTPDLKSLAKVVEDEDCYDDEQVLGDMDASDFYARKSMGASSRKNGMKLRPDEAKRKEFIMYKKNAQRMRNS